MNKHRFFSIICFFLAGMTLFAGVGNLVIRSFYGYGPKVWFVLLILGISGGLIWAGIKFWEKK